MSDFDRDGWSVSHGLFGREEIAAMHDVFTSIIPDHASLPSGLGEVAGASAAYDALARIAHDRRLGAFAAAALDARNVQLLQDSLLYKPAGGGGRVDWHQDYTYLGFLTPPRVVTLRIALLPESEATGCMRVVSGSHAWGQVGDVRALTEHRVESLLPSLSDEQRAAVERATPLVLEPGDVSVHHCLTLHGSGPNSSQAPRRTIILRMFDRRCRVDALRLPAGAAALFPTDADGALAASAFPIVF